MIQLVQGAAPPAADDGIRRRDFLNVAALSFGGVGGLAATLPLIAQMSPSADLLAAASTEVCARSSSPEATCKSAEGSSSSIATLMSVLAATPSRPRYGARQD